MLRTGAAFVAAVALVASGVLSAPAAQAAMIKVPMSLTATPKQTRIVAFGDTNVTISWTGCYAYGLRVEQLRDGEWVRIGGGYESAGGKTEPCPATKRTATLKLIDLLGGDYKKQLVSLNMGKNTLRLVGSTWGGKTADGDYWYDTSGVSNTFTLTVVKARAKITGWSTRTLTVRPGSAFTLPRVAIENPGGYGNLVLQEVNYGFGWVCLGVGEQVHPGDASVSYGCDNMNSKTSKNLKITRAAQKIKPDAKWNLQLKYRYRVLSNAYVVGAVSPVITVRFTSGVPRTAKATRAALKITGKQRYLKSQATFTGIVNQKKATGGISFARFQKSKYGSYELAWWQTGPRPIKNGRVSYTFGTMIAKGTYVTVAVYRSNAPTKFKDSMSKPVILRVT